jgi:hypothetical protein
MFLLYKQHFVGKYTYEQYGQGGALPRTRSSKNSHSYMLFVMMPLSAVYQSRTLSSLHFPFSHTKVIDTWWWIWKLTKVRMSFHSTHTFPNSNSNKIKCIWTETSYKIIEPCTCLERYRLECFIITGNHYHRFIFRDCGSIYWAAVAEDVEKSNIEVCEPTTGPVWPIGGVEV